MIRFGRTRWWIGAILSCLLAGPLFAETRPAEVLLPSTTRACLQVSDMDRLRQDFQRTELGRLLDDPAMQPFSEDLRRQLREKLSASGRRIGIAWEDVEAVYGGEVCVAAIQPDDDKTRHALIMLVDVTGHLPEANELLQKIRKRQEEKGAKRELKRITDTDSQFTIYTLPKETGEKRSRQLVFFIHDDWLVAVNELGAALDIYLRMAGKRQGGLDTVPAYRESLGRVARGAGSTSPHLRWFLDPFGFVAWQRASEGNPKRRGTDWYKILSNQGFQAIQGIAGDVTFATDGQEILHRTMVYAPPVKRGEEDTFGDKYDLAARMLNFPRSDDLFAPEWVPRDMAVFLTFNWKMQAAANYVSTLVDEVIGDEGAWEDMKKSLRVDKHGPRIDVDKHFFPYLGERVTLLTNYEIPITPNSEWLLLAIETNNPEGLATTVRKAMESDRNAKETKVHGHTVWEISEQPAAAVNPPAVGGLPFGFEDDEVFDEDEELEPLFPNKAVAIAHGHLMISTNFKQLRDVLAIRDTADALSASRDYEVVNAGLSKLGAGDDSLRLFSRTAEEFRPTYELLRQGKMPESKMLLGRILNEILGPEDDEQLRKQEIDGSKLPEFKIVRRYLGPAGVFVQPERDGWFVTGAWLPKVVNPHGERVADEGGRPRN